MRIGKGSACRRLGTGLAALICLGAGAGAQAADASDPLAQFAQADDPEVQALVSEYGSIVAARPEAAPAWGDLGMAYEANGMMSEALACYEHALELEAEARPRALWRYRLAIVLRKVGDLERAAREMEQVAEVFAQTEAILVRHGEMLLELGQPVQAEAAYATALEVGRERALDEARRGVKGPRFHHAHVGLARVHLMLDEPAAALEQADQALALAPGAKDAQYTKGLALRLLGRLDDARLYLSLGQDAGSTYPSDPHVRKLQGLVRGFSRGMRTAENLLATGSPEDIAFALRILSALDRSHPKNAFILNLIGKAHSLAGALEDAEESYRASLAADPSSYDTHLLLAMTLINSGRLAEALVMAERAVELAPGLGRPHYVRGLIYLNQGDREDAALAALTRAQELGCREPEMYFALAQIHLRRGETEQGVRFARLARDRGPHSATFHLIYAQAAITTQAWDEALAAIEAAASIAPQDQRVDLMRRALAQARRAGGR